MGWFDDYKTVKCRDGSTRQVLKRMDKVTKLFSAQFKDLNFAIKGIVSTAEIIARTEVGSEVTTHTKTILDKLNGLESMALQKYSAAYLAYSSNPCDNDRVLNDAIAAINASYDKLLPVSQNLSEARHIIRPPSFRDRVQNHPLPGSRWNRPSDRVPDEAQPIPFPPTKVRSPTEAFQYLDAAKTKLSEIEKDLK